MTKIKIQELVQQRMANTIELPKMVEQLFKVANDAKFGEELPSLTNTVFDERQNKNAY